MILAYFLAGDDNDLHGWRLVAAQYYTDVQQHATGSEEWLRWGLELIQDVFLVLTEKPEFDSETSELPAQYDTDVETLESLVRDFEQNSNGQPGTHTTVELLNQKIAEMKQRSAPPPWWQVTVRIIQRAIELGFDPESFKLSAEDLRNLAIRSPEAIRPMLLDCLREGLPRRLPAVLRHSPRSALGLIQLLCDYVESPPFDRIWKALDDYVMDLALDTDQDQQLVAFFEEGASIYHRLLDEYRKSKNSSLIRPSAIKNHLSEVIDRMREPSNAQNDCELLIKGLGGLTAWQDLLEHDEIRVLDGIDQLRDALHIPASVLHEYAASNQQSRWRLNDNEPEAILGPYDIKRPDTHMNNEWKLSDVEVSGIPRGKLRNCFGIYRGERVHVKIYDLSSKKSNAFIRHLLYELWEKERRVLSDISSRGQGRGLTKLKQSFMDEANNRLIVLTDAYHHQTLREFIDQGRAALQRRDRREELWAELSALIEGVHALHEAHYMHRNIRPENIFLIKQNNREQFKLGNFEWSVYIRALAEEKGKETRYFDRYAAPEVVKNRLNKLDEQTGENFSSDVNGTSLSCLSRF